jgi:hypothetical protein
MAKDFDLPGIVPWGRRFDEYAAFFALEESDLRARGPVLDVGGGPASFTAEALAKNISVTAVDPLYAYDGALIPARFDATCEAMMAGVHRAHARFLWTYYESPEVLERTRREALEIFLADFELGRAVGRYVAHALPNLPFADNSFGVALCSHLLFLYSETLDLTFHIAALLEMLRVAREVRVYPLQDLDGQPSAHLPGVITALRERGIAVDVAPVAYQFQKGSTHMLRARA